LSVLARAPETLTQQAKANRTMGSIYSETYKVDVATILGQKEGVGTCTDSDFLDFRGLAAKLGTTEQWVRRNVRRTYTRDPIPHLRFGRSFRFMWDSAEMQEWIERRKDISGETKTRSISSRPASHNVKRTEFGPNRKEKMQ
jgi:predicted DNA-binding transcriptional regulator AlpA